MPVLQLAPFLKCDTFVLERGVGQHKSKPYFLGNPGNVEVCELDFFTCHLSIL